MSYEPEYTAWANIIKRCTNPKDPSFANYGGRGIRICDEWRQSFAAFIRDMEPRPGPGYTIDRVDNDGNYEPGNCKWSTRKEQQNNRRVTRFVTYRGRRVRVTDLATELHVTYDTLMRRLVRHNVLTIEGDEVWLRHMLANSRRIRKARLASQ